MADVRKLDLLKKGFTKVESVSPDQYKLGPERLNLLESVISEIASLPYWSPQYTAWEPFLFAYMQSGITPELAKKWLPILSDKIEMFRPPCCERSEIFAEVQRFYRVNSCEVFRGYTWDRIEEFVNWIPTLIDNRKEILSFIFSKDRCNKIFEALLEDTDPETGLSLNLPYAIYMYRHLEDISTCSPANKEKLAAQLTVYNNVFSESFDTVMGFIGDQQEVYAWYSKKIKHLIMNAWSTSLDLSANRDIITPSDVFTMPVWLSEQITDYLNTLPCVYTEMPNQTFVFDAVVYALKEKDYSKKEIIYANCLSKDTIKSMINRLSTFYWDVKEDRFVQTIIDMVDAQHTVSGFSPDTKTAAEYSEELKRRGFPVPGGV